MRIHRHRVRKPKITIPQYKLNERIESETVRVIDENGQPLGVLKTEEAVRLAHERELDLVEVSPLAQPPVAKFLDYSQFKYQKEKEVRKQKAQSREVEVKGIRLSLRIGEHDFEIRCQQGKKFLERGDKLRIEIVLRGREKAHVDLAQEIILKFVEVLKKDFPLRVEQPFSKQGSRLTMIVAR
ncbi:MAG: Translation initiation factor IF-3 [Candidatus Uhrbacteria bacterium GW2011_GWF2_41_16]|jgi:translation initiation factor IF-3|uniref:Translation initiation factor IF-3 n=2 Tax=Candidatus Uhriibacteriota TaxID=1752732 RepID=A0A0G0VG52_9BACT|nr:MAG: Translation initiation factor IF-3 [Candidatus Uhrbacteria bacterium GW2011_GWA2_41_10]KKR87621.1 MAG: Translation initiation factor IF-3 [Candidatus Uhrbacteria bacterium GW2011_GWC2_41_11]KKR98601.1 MAG: Translation initiation factor IF-3 [Candidatus Uhrbacteria bacterium GW2011_GWF2_41_16]